MYDSAISCAAMLTAVKSEADISTTIPVASYVMWINTVEQLLYTEYIREQRSVILADAESPVAMQLIVPETGEKQPLYDDIFKVYADEKELQKMTLTAAKRFSRNAYWCEEGKLCYRCYYGMPDELRIIYFVRPALKTESGSTVSGNIMLPVEFADIIYTRIRGEIYKIANEDALSAKWITEYNTLLENFKVWLSRKAAEYGER